MFFRWLKKYMPHSLYARAALILLVPMVSVQLVVSVIFVQRHFNSITRQMTEVVAAEMAYLVRQVNSADSLAAAQARLEALAPALLIEAQLPAADLVHDAKAWSDFTGGRVMRSLYSHVPGLSGVDLASELGRANLAIDTDWGLLDVSLARTRLSASNPHQLLVYMVSIGVIMTIIAYIFLRNQLRPIKRLGRAAEAFGRGQVIDYKVSGATEVRAAGRAFLDMRARILAQIESRTMMLSGISHDLRTPLTRFRLGLSMIEESEERTALEQDVAEMEKLVDAFLGYARAEAHSDDDQEPGERISPGILLEQVVARARRAGQQITIHTGPALPPMQFRVMALSRALDNLISNAARYGSHTRVSLEQGEDWIAFVIEDDGPGIAPDKQQEALKPFTRLDRARNQDRGAGVGLGLAIAANIAHAHGGSLRLGRSATLGGLRAELRLPLRNQATATQEANQA